MKKPATQPDDLILVTGGAGYIGSHFVRMLLDKGYRVRVLDTFLYGTSGLTDCASDPRLEVGVRGHLQHPRHDPCRQGRQGRHRACCVGR